MESLSIFKTIINQDISAGHLLNWRKKTRAALKALSLTHYVSLAMQSTGVWSL